MHKFLAEGKTANGYAADDGAAAHFINDEFDRAVSSRPDAKVYKVNNVDGQVREETIETRYLGQVWGGQSCENNL